MHFSRLLSTNCVGAATVALAGDVVAAVIVLILYVRVRHERSERIFFHAAFWVPTPSCCP